MIRFRLLPLDGALDGADNAERVLQQLLPPPDLENLGRYKDKQARLHYLGGRALLRHALSQAADVEPQAWRFRYGEQGKPELAPPFDRTRLVFSISHSAGAVVCAVAAGRNVGVDVEWLGRRVDECEIARRFFSAPEALDIERRSGSERSRRFFASWTLREAYVKARGEGLFHSLDGIVCDLDGRDGSPRLLDPSPADRGLAWGFSLWQPMADYCVALCMERPVGEEKHVSVIESQVITLDLSSGSAVLRASPSNAVSSQRKFL